MKLSSKHVDVLMISSKRKEGKEFFFKFPPLAYTYFRSLLNERNISSDIIDLQLTPFTEDELIEIIKLKNPLIVGFSLFGFTLPFSYRIIQRVKQIFPEIIVVAGGSQVNANPGIVNQINADYGFYGDCEFAFADFCDDIVNRRSVNTSADSLIINKGEFRINKKQVIDLNTLPIPDYDYINIPEYYSPIFKTSFFTAETSRGCPYACAFCDKNIKTKFRTFSTDWIENNLEALVNKHKVGYIEFVDEILTCREDRVVEICEMILRNDFKFRWRFMARATDISHETINLIKRAGGSEVIIGIEFGNEDIRSKIGKNISNEKYTQTINHYYKKGIMVWGTFIIGHQDESKKEMNETISFARKSNIFFPHFFHLNLMPGSMIMRDAVSEGLVEKDIWEKHMKGEVNKPYYPHPKLSSETIDKIVKKAYLMFLVTPKHFFRLSWFVLKRGLVFSVIRIIYYMMSVKKNKFHY